MQKIIVVRVVSFSFGAFSVVAAEMQRSFVPLSAPKLGKYSTCAK